MIPATRYRRIIMLIYSLLLSAMAEPTTENSSEVIGELTVEAL